MSFNTHKSTLISKLERNCSTPYLNNYDEHNCANSDEIKTPPTPFNDPDECEPILKLSFRIKLTLVITLLSVALTSIGMWSFYIISYKMMIDRIGKNLLDVGRLGTTLFDEECIEAIHYLKRESEKETQLTTAEIIGIPVNTIKSSLTPETILRLNAHKSTQALVNVLRVISLSSMHNRPMNLDNFNPDDHFKNLNAGMIATYLYVDIKESPDKTIVKYIASANTSFDTIALIGAQIGTLQRYAESIRVIFNGNACVNDHLITDTFYTSLPAGVPIIDKQGEVVAILGLDYPVGMELNKLEQLRITSYIVIATSFIVGLILSFFISKRMSTSLNQLHRAAVQITEGNYDVRTTISNKDEFGLLGHVFNEMTCSIQQTTDELNNNNDRLRSITADMHDGVGAILVNIQVASRPHSTVDVRNIHKLSLQGLNEVRFLMDALDYEHSNLEMISSGIEILVGDILEPQQIDCTIHNSFTEDREVPFQLYLDLQRIMREAFTNIIKHSTATACEINLALIDNTIHCSISDNGQPSSNTTIQSNGRGLKNMQHRVERYYGEFSHVQDDTGFHLTMTLEIS